MSKNKNAVLVINQRYLQDLNIWQKEEIKRHQELGGIVNIRTNVRDDESPFYSYVPLKAGLFGKAEQPQQEEVPTGMRGYVPGFGFVSGTENA